MAMSRVGLLVVALVLALGAGWAIGASGRSDVELALGQARRHAEAMAVRAALLEARLDLSGADVNGAHGQLQQARAIAIRLQRELRETRQAEQAGRLEIAIAHVVDADHLAGTAASDAQAATVDALRALEAIDIGAK